MHLLSLFLGLFGFASQTLATVVTYQFTGTLAPSSTGTSTINLGSGVVDVSGSSFLITGQTTNDVDALPGNPVVGLFTATSTYDFGSFGTFATDAGSDSFFQFGISTSTIVRVGLSDAVGSSAFAPSVNAIAADPNVLTGIGSFSGTDIIETDLANPFEKSNGSGQSITLFFDESSVSSFSTSVIPEPSSLLLLGLAGTFLAVRRRRR